MDTAQWQQLKAYVDHALDLPAAERAAFLEVVGAEAPALRDELTSLLRAYDEAPGYLEDASAPALLQLPAAAAPDTDGAVGPYRLVRELGRGGMGTVYLALRDDAHYQQLVALKLVRPGLGDDVPWRFYRERQILAGLNHPHIARLLDGGATADGQPYLVMEYVEGLPIDAYAAQHGLSVAERLRLFLPVCDAAAYAHRNLVVHRDLKPSNILVTSEGAVKLLDFGIAKLLGAEPGAGGATETLRPAFTPEYAAPEQVRGEATTTATDVYALGVVLYELLTGARPYAFPAGRSLTEAARVVCEVVPPRPSLAPGAEARRLAGDLDTIVLKALQKEPERRYASVDALADDVRRHLEGLPILARPDTLGYRTRKFVRRHRWGVAAAAALVALLVGSSILLAAQARRTARERDRALAVAGFLESLFTAANPAEGKGVDTPVGEVLQTAALRISTELEQQPAVQATLMDLIGHIYTQLGAYPEAEPLLRLALSRREGLFSPAHPDVTESLSHLGQLRARRGDYAAAESLFTRVLALRARAPATERAAALHQLGDLAVWQADYARADSLLKAALALRQSLPPDDPALIDNLGSLAVLHTQRAEYAQAAALLRDLLARRRRRFGPRHPDVAITLSDIGHVLAKYTDPDSLRRAEAYFRQALALYRDLYRDGHPDMAGTLNNLVSLLARLDRLDEAARLAEESIAMKRRIYGDSHPSLALSLNNLAHVHLLRQDYDAALALMGEALPMQRAALGPEHPDLALLLYNRATVQRRLGNHQAAAEGFAEALVVYRAAYGPDHSETVWVTMDLGRAWQEAGRCDRALPLLRRALAAPEETLAAIPVAGDARAALARCGG